jgi:hypothetical protein
MTEKVRTTYFLWKEKAPSVYLLFISLLKKHWKFILVTGIFIIFLCFSWRWHINTDRRWLDWTGFGEYYGSLPPDRRGRTLWDWLELLFVPVALAMVAWLFQRQERKNELLFSDNQNQEVVLQNYFKIMSELILKENLFGVKTFRTNDLIENRESLGTSMWETRLPEKLRAVRAVAQAHTFQAIRQLNTSRKRTLIQYIKDADIGDFLLESASLQGVNLSGLDLSCLNFNRANLIDANFQDSILYKCKLCNAKLKQSDFRRSNLIYAQFHNANLDGTNFECADLQGTAFDGGSMLGANLFKAKLSHVSSFVNTKLDNVNMRNVKISGDFTNASIQGANLSTVIVTDSTIFVNTNLCHATLQGATIEGSAQLTSVILTNTIMPDGKRSELSGTAGSSTFDSYKKN